jgi:hypothetical protein
MPSTYQPERRRTKQSLSDIPQIDLGSNSFLHWVRVPGKREAPTLFATNFEPGGLAVDTPSDAEFLC